MDVAYDQIQEDSFPDEEAARKSTEAGEQQSSAGPNSLNTEFQEAYKAISSSPWGMRLGGILGSVKKQGETYYEGARKEYSTASAQAARGLTSIRTTVANQAKSLPVGATGTATASSSDLTAQPKEKGKEVHTDEEAGNKYNEASTDATAESVDSEESAKKIVSEAAERPDSLPADIVKEAEGMLSRLRVEAGKRLKDIERAEDAADEALLRFGTNITNFLRDAVTIAPPTGDEVLATAGQQRDGESTVMFESKDPEGKRVIHSNRFDAQLHAIHSSAASFTRDPPSSEFEPWAEKTFGDPAAPERTEQIARDLEKYEELRRAMEKLVPEQVEYGTFWKRYYFLRHVIETEEKRRKEMLKDAAASPEEEVGWDEDSDSEDNGSPSTTSKTRNNKPLPLSSSKETLKAPETTTAPSPSASTATKTDNAASPKDAALLKPAAEPRKSNDAQSQADSDASYDLVSGATSRAPGSPKEVKKEEKGTKADEDSDEDWE